MSLMIWPEVSNNLHAKSPLSRDEDQKNQVFIESNLYARNGVKNSIQRDCGQKACDADSALNPALLKGNDNKQ